MKILLTSTSFQDTPGKHQDLLNSTGFEVHILRGPVKKDALLPIISDFDGIICGDDEYTSDVIEKGKNGNLKVISKYGIGLDKIDLEAAKKLGIIVTNCPGVNHTTVAEHVFALLLSYTKNIPKEIQYTKNGEWKRLTGNEIYGKTIGIVGLGKIGKEVAKRAFAFGMSINGYDTYWDEEFSNQFHIKRCINISELTKNSDIISLHTNLDNSTRGIISKSIIENDLKAGTIIINTARGELIDLESMILGLKTKKVGAYLTDVLDEEPMPSNYHLKDFDNVFITPHIGSRTYESVERQGTMAVENLIKNLK